MHLNAIVCRREEGSNCCLFASCGHHSLPGDLNGHIGDVRNTRKGVFGGNGLPDMEFFFGYLRISPPLFADIMLLLCDLQCTLEWFKPKLG